MHYGALVEMNTRAKRHPQRATSDNDAASIKPPTRCKLPVTKTLTSSSFDSDTRLLTTFTACSMVGTIWMLDWGNEGFRSDQTDASSFCVLSWASSCSEVDTAVKSGDKIACETQPQETSLISNLSSSPHWCTWRWYRRWQGRRKFGSLRLDHKFSAELLEPSALW